MPLQSEAHHCSCQSGGFAARGVTYAPLAAAAAAGVAAAAADLLMTAAALAAGAAAAEAAGMWTTWG